MEEKIIVTLTSYKHRLANLPTVLDTIFVQNMPPDVVVLNIAYGEVLPDNVADYLKDHGVDIFRVADTKVYKKLIPTLKRYPHDVIITIDDDFLYPSGMIEDFMSIHTKHPNNPISGNQEVFYGMQCHCGCASLTKAKFFGEYLYQINDELIKNCPSDDMVYTFFALKAGYPYLQTENEYFLNMIECNINGNKSYTDMINGDTGVINTYRYLVNRFGELKNTTALYVHDEDIAKVIDNIHKKTEWKIENEIRSSHAYRLGKKILKPIIKAKKMIGK
ncbi:MAG: hypothetical protein IJ524_09915 [Bacteroidales bacterium]|nr:hypothetical protein [Bacteroidales bacterium]